MENADRPINPGVDDMLWHLAVGELTLYRRDEDVGRRVNWVKYSHRGVQFLDRLEIPKGQRRYVFSPKFEIRFDGAFDECLRRCADREDEQGTWLTPAVMEGYRNLHRAGYAHTIEAWQGDRLAGGCLTVQIGAWVSCTSMFYCISNGSKAAWGQGLCRLRERGFKWIDVNSVASHAVQYGEQWVPQWQFEQMQWEAMKECRTMEEGVASVPLPMKLRVMIPAARKLRAVGQKLKLIGREAVVQRMGAGAGSS